MNIDHHAAPGCSFRRIVWPLAVAETIVWAAYYYSFPALLLIWERDLGWTKAELAGAFTLALLVSATLAPVVGRLIDRGFAEQIFAGGAMLGALLLAALSAMNALWQFYLIWLGLGVAMAATLYEACFAVLTCSLGKAAKRGITRVALVAGFAGTVSFPSAHILSSWFGWRSAVLVFAAAVALIALPLIIIACRTARPHFGAHAQPASLKVTDAIKVIRLSAFWWLSVLFAAIALGHGVLLTHLLAILDARGVEQKTAVIAASMIGPMQVAGRLLMITLGRHASTFAVFVVCMMFTALASLSLLQADVSIVFLYGFVALQGAGYGVTSIIKPIFVAERLGRQNFGTVAGFLAIAFVGGSAIAPTMAAMIWKLGGYDPVIWFALVLSILGLVALAAIGRPVTTEPG
ncbi:MAG: MFS transporter [Geminicoccales bacterium]